MSHAAAALPADRIDAKRILATSGAIVVHVAILMMLLLPPEVKQADTREEVIVPNWEPEHVLPPPPPPPPPIRRVEVVQHQAAPVRLSPPDPPVDPVDDQTRYNDTPPPPSDPPQSFDVGTTASSEFQQLQVLFGPAPQYPKPAIMRGLEGTVTLRIHVDASGKPMEVMLEKSSGSRLLDEAAMKVVRSRWTFVPAQSGGQAIDSWGLLPVQFSLQQ